MVCINAFAATVATSAIKYYELVKAVATSGEVDPLGDALTAHAGTLSELSLAFPMESWHVDQRAVLSELAASAAATAFEDKFIGALTPLIATWEGVELPKG